MKETRFIAQNKEKWLESETLLKDSQKDPEKLSNLFTQVVDDLSYSRTYYQNRSVRVYLNKIAREYFSIIYSHQKEKKNRFALFWLDEIPQIIIYARKQLLISLMVFLFSASIGIFSSMKDSHFTASILGEEYVSMTKENIKSGDPMAVYKKGHQVDMFLGITFNNLMVAFRTYVFGIFLSIGTLSILLYNGIMVGCFQYFFIEHGLFAESALTIWLHGTLEISSIILAGGAGLTLGTGLIFPGTYSRIQAFQISAIRSLKLMLSISPLFVIAGIIESFLTRYTDVPDVLRLLLIILSACIIIGYFVVFPWLKSKRGFAVPLEEVRLQSTLAEPVNFTRIKNNAEILKDAFLFYKKNFNGLLPYILMASIAISIGKFFIETGPRMDINNEWTDFFLNLFYALQTPTPAFIFINALCSAVVIHRTFLLIDRDSKKEDSTGVNIKALVQIFIIVSLLFGALYGLDGWGTLLVFFLFGILLLCGFAQQAEKSNLLFGIARTRELGTGNYSQIIGLQFILLLMSFSFLIVLSAPLLYMYTNILQWNFAKTDEWAKAVINAVEIFFKVLAFNLVLPLLAASIAYLYFTFSEIQSADTLKKAIERIGMKTASKNIRL